MSKHRIIVGVLSIGDGSAQSFVELRADWYFGIDVEGPLVIEIPLRICLMLYIYIMCPVLEDVEVDSS